MDKLGILLINKPVGISSFDIIRRLRRVINIKQLGHAGTLDPFAQGLMQILVGKATKVAQYLTNYDKSYRVTMQFGIKTDTGDITGQTIQQSEIEPFIIDFQKLKENVECLTEQIPPIYSAIKINGQRAYKLARKEQDVIMDPRPIKVYDFQVLEYSFPNLTYQCHVSKGTYIRALTEQIATMFGTIATTIKLTRISVADMLVEDAVDLDNITADNWEQFLLPIDKFIDCPIVNLTEEQDHDFWYGRPIKLNSHPDSDLVIAKYDEQTKGLGKVVNSTLLPRKVFK